MTWGLAKFLGGVVLGAALVGLIAKLRQLMRVRRQAREEVGAVVEAVDKAAGDHVARLSDDEFLQEWEKFGGGE